MQMLRPDLIADERVLSPSKYVIAARVVRMKDAEATVIQHHR